MIKKIRIGMIRCDLHAYWYALLFAPSDWHLVLKYTPPLHYYFYQRSEPDKLVDLTCSWKCAEVPIVPGLELTKVWDKDRQEAEKMAETFLNKPIVCDTLDEVSDDVDMVFIADCYGEGKDHLELAIPSLEKGIPTFVDKPFSYTLKDAQTMVNIAQKNNIPLMSCSLLRQVPQARYLRNRFEEISPVGMGVVKGVGAGHLGAIIHGISLAQHVFGEGVEWVECMGTIPLEFLHLHYRGEEEGIEVIVISSHLHGPKCGYRCEVYSRRGSIHSSWIDDHIFPQGGVVILNMLKEMVQTHKPPISYKSMLELMEIVEAGRISQKEGKQVYLKDIR